LVASGATATLAVVSCPDESEAPESWRGAGVPEPPPARDLAGALTGEAIALLRDTYLLRLERALRTLPAADLWWRPHEGSNSAGNLLLHLQGNIHQWICCGLGGAPDHRERDAEFAAASGADAAALLAALRSTVEQACRVIAGLDAAALAGRVRVQGFELTRLAAVLHVTEHMSWHAGQIAWIAKARAGEGHGLHYYDDGGLRAHNEP
jgi:uncharacterized damage-inducible protein DinB